MAVYFKFKAAKDYDSISIDGPFITVADLKDKIIQQKQLGSATDFELVILHAQSGEELNEDSHLIQKNTSVVIKRVPSIRPKVAPRLEPANRKPLIESSIIEPDDGFGEDILSDLVPVRNEVDFTGEDSKSKQKLAEEEARLAAAISQQSKDWQKQAQEMTMPAGRGGAGRGVGRGTAPGRYGFSHPGRGVGMTPPEGYVCHRCGQPGHFIQFCPTNGDPNFDIKKMKSAMGIPRSRQLPDDAGSLMSRDGRAVKLLPDDAEFSREAKSVLALRQLTENPPKHLMCPVDKKLFDNAVLVPCCSETFCDKCIRDSLLNKGFCPGCNSSATTVDDIRINSRVREAVEHFKASFSSDSLPKPPPPPPPPALPPPPKETAAAEKSVAVLEKERTPETAKPAVEKLVKAPPAAEPPELRAAVGAPNEQGKNEEPTKGSQVEATEQKAVEERSGEKSGTGKEAEPGAEFEAGLDDGRQLDVHQEAGDMVEDSPMPKVKLGSRPCDICGSFEHPPWDCPNRMPYHNFAPPFGFRPPFEPGFNPMYPMPPPGTFPPYGPPMPLYEPGPGYGMGFGMRPAGMYPYGPRGAFPPFDGPPFHGPPPPGPFPLPGPLGSEESLDVEGFARKRSEMKQKREMRRRMMEGDMDEEDRDREDDTVEKAAGRSEAGGGARRRSEEAEEGARRSSKEEPYSSRGRREYHSEHGRQRYTTTRLGPRAYAGDREDDEEEPRRPRKHAQDRNGSIEAERRAHKGPLGRPSDVDGDGDAAGSPAGRKRAGEEGSEGEGEGGRKKQHRSKRGGKEQEKRSKSDGEEEEEEDRSAPRSSSGSKGRQERKRRSVDDHSAERKSRRKKAEKSEKGKSRSERGRGRDDKETRWELDQ